MNERIQELAFEFAEQYDWNPPHEPTNYTFAAGDLEKFAESIVREVFSKLEDEGFEVYEPVIEAVKKHFGVK